MTGICVPVWAGHGVYLLGLRRHKAARLSGVCALVFLGALLSRQALAEDIPRLAEAEFRTFAVEDLDLRMPSPGSSDVVAVAGATTIPGYPLSAEELSLVLDTSEPGSGFSRLPVAVEYSTEQNRPPLRVRLMGWIKQRSSDFNLFKLFNADDSAPGMRLDVDTDAEELVLEYRVGF